MMNRRSQTLGPTNIDLINILRCRIEKDERPSFITDMHNLYEKEPWLLQHVRQASSVENLWFYFVTRKQRPGIKKTDSTRPSRKVAESGRWKTTGILVLSHIEDKDGDRVGFVKTMSFKVNSETVKDGITTGWVMHEFVLDKPGFQELVLCRIRFHPRKDNGQYAPRHAPILMGLERGDSSKSVEKNSQNYMTSVHHGVAAPVEAHQNQGMEQWTGSCSGEVVSNLALQHQQNNVAQDSNYQHFRSYGQQKNPIPGHMEHYGHGSGDRVEYQNQCLGQETTDPKKVPMMANQALNDYYGHLPSQHFSVNVSQEQHQSLRSYGGVLGESSRQQQHHILGRQATHLSLMEVQLSAQATEEQQQQWNEYSGLYSFKPHVQRMIDRQICGSSTLRMAQKNENLRQKSDILSLIELDAQQKHLSQDSNLRLTQQKNKILGQNNELPTVPMENLQPQNNELPMVPVKTEQGQHNELPTVPMETLQQQNNELPTVSMKTEQQQDSFVRNSAGQIHLQAQDDVALIDQTMEALATNPPIDSQEHQEQLLGDDFFEGMDTEMADLSDDFCVDDFAQQFEKIPIPDSIFY